MTAYAGWAQGDRDSISHGAERRTSSENQVDDQRILPAVNIGHRYEALVRNAKKEDSRHT